MRFDKRKLELSKRIPAIVYNRCALIGKRVLLLQRPSVSPHSTSLPWDYSDDCKMRRW